MAMFLNCLFLLSSLFLLLQQTFEGLLEGPFMIGVPKMSV